MTAMTRDATEAKPPQPVSSNATMPMSAEAVIVTAAQAADQARATSTATSDSMKLSRPKPTMTVEGINGRCRILAAMFPTDLWPPAGLRLTADDMTLTCLDEVAITALARDCARPGDVFADPSVPWVFPWLGGPAAGTIAFSLSTLASFGARGWVLKLWASSRTGDTVGSIDLRHLAGEAVPTVDTGSFVLVRHQGRGYGRLLRRAALQLAFALGAERVTSGAHPDNAPSIAVSRGLGYRDCAAPPGVDDGHLWFECTPEAFARATRSGDPTVLIEGLTPQLRAMLPM